MIEICAPRTDKAFDKPPKGGYNGGMKNEVINIVGFNVASANLIGVRYEFTNGWALSVHTQKRGISHECALIDGKTGKIVYSTNLSGRKDLLYLTSGDVIGLVNAMAESVDDTLLRVEQWVAKEIDLIAQDVLFDAKL